MEIFAKLFERFLVFVYHCFDRIVIQGYLPLLSRPAPVIYFFPTCWDNIQSHPRFWPSALPNIGAGSRAMLAITRSPSRGRRKGWTRKTSCARIWRA